MDARLLEQPAWLDGASSQSMFDEELAAATEIADRPVELAIIVSGESG